MRSRRSADFSPQVLTYVHFEVLPIVYCTGDLRFLQQHFNARGQQTVNTSSELQSEFTSVHGVLNRNFDLITRRSGALELLVAPDSCQGAIRPHKLTLGAKIAPPQNKLNHFTHLNRVELRPELSRSLPALVKKWEDPTPILLC